MAASAVDPRLAAAVELFNTGEFFACHDVLEEIWSETLTDDRTCYQGLIHAAVALHHFSEGNLGGARKMSFSAERYLAPYAPSHAGLALDAFLRDFRHCFHELQTATEATIQHVELRSETTPLLQWSAAPNR